MTPRFSWFLKELLVHLAELVLHILDEQSKAGQVPTESVVQKMAAVQSKVAALRDTEVKP